MTGAAFLYRLEIMKLLGLKFPDTTVAITQFLLRKGKDSGVVLLFQHNRIFEKEDI